jgi:hypothetical protein
MSWLWKTLAVLGGAILAGAAIGTAREWPALRRYLKIRSL